MHTNNNLEEFVQIFEQQIVLVILFSCEIRIAPHKRVVICGDLLSKNAIFSIGFQGSLPKAPAMIQTRHEDIILPSIPKNHRREIAVFCIRVPAFQDEQLRITPNSSRRHGGWSKAVGCRVQTCRHHRLCSNTD